MRHGPSKIQYGVTQYNQHLFVLSSERPGQRTISRVCHDSFFDPLPELTQRGPELLAMAADHESSLLLFLIFPFEAHAFGNFPRHLAGVTPYAALKLRLKWPASH